MYTCEICGRKIRKKNRIGGYTVCSKHMHQYQKYGRFLDQIARTNRDLNDFRVEGKTAVFSVYGQDNRKQGEFIIDMEDVPRVRYHKWRFSHQHIVTGQPARHGQRELSHIILNVPKDRDADTVVDHINGNPSDNRKANLRICTQAENLENKRFMSNSTSGMIGVVYDKARGRWAPEIRKGYVRCHLGRYETLPEAAYARYVAEDLLFGVFCNAEDHRKKSDCSSTLSDLQKENITCIIKAKLKKKKLWPSVM